jgi:MYXO-CTERM domain-containing protein
VDQCDTTHVDLDGDAANGCEYACIENGNERCNGADDDCDGEIDENLSCGGASGPGPVIDSFAASATAVEAGMPVTLSWSVSDATTVTLNGEPVDPTGSLEVFPTTTSTYTLVATNDEGTNTQSVTVQVLTVEATTEVDPMDDSGQCTCRAAGGGSGLAGFAGLLFVVAAFFVRRRRAP